MTSKEWLIVGISGATCSGKSTLAKELHKSIKDSVLIHQDDYFFPVNDPRHTKIPELNCLNWEITTSMDMNKMYSDVLNVIKAMPGRTNVNETNEKSVLILDGFLLFKSKDISDTCDVKYFLTLSKEQCWERRKNRVYDPPDVPGYFEKVVWPEYMKHQAEITSNEELRQTITFIDGVKNKRDIYEMVYEEIQKRMY